MKSPNMNIGIRLVSSVALVAGALSLGACAKAENPVEVRCVNFDMGTHSSARQASIDALKLAGVTLDDKSGLSAAVSTEIKDLADLHKKQGTIYSQGNLPAGKDRIDLCLDGNTIVAGPGTQAIEVKQSSVPAADIIVSNTDGTQISIQWPKK